MFENYEKLIKAIDETGEPPCTKFDCPCFKDCRDLKMQCTAFNAYVETGGSHDPYYKYGYRKVDGYNQYVRLERQLFPKPSQKLYELGNKD